MKKLFPKIVMTAVLTGIGILLLTSCRVKSESQLARYANGNFGSCTLLSAETTEAGSKICTFRDEEYGFEYYVKSEMHDINIDGSKFGSTESTDSDFSTKYYELLMTRHKTDFEKIAESDRVEISFEGYFDFMKIKCITDKSNFLETAEKISDIIISFDDRGYYKNLHFGVYDRNDRRLGAYYIHEKKWVDVSDEDDDFYKERAKILNRNAAFVRKEKKLFKDTGFAPDQVRISLGDTEYTYETPVCYYYFTVNGKEFFIADFILKDHFSDIYQYNNYDEVFG